MCRIVGFINQKGMDERTVLPRMRDTMIHGGPDDAGAYFDEQVSLGHRRLSIIDLSPHGHQPMVTAQGDLVLVYNGEIYNFLEIRTDLEKKGYRFCGHSDSEVLLYAYQEWGIECIHRFRGMFAFCVYEKSVGRLVLVRDRAGIKPLYYYFDGQHFAFASEVKAFHQYPNFQKRLSHAGLTSFLQYSYILAPYTIFENCYKIRPGHYLEVSFREGEIVLNEDKYWDVFDSYRAEPLPLPYAEARDWLEGILAESFRLRMVADVPVGMFLSGGIDSSTLLAILSREVSGRIKTFTIGFEENDFNEAEYAKEIARHCGTEHHEYYLSTRDSIDIIPRLPNIWDEPFADTSQIPTYLLSRFTREHVTVSLSADGGDEQFFGYPKYLLTEGRTRTIDRFNVLFQALRLVPDAGLVALGHAFRIGDKLLKIKAALAESNCFRGTFQIGQQIYSESYLNQILQNQDRKALETGFDDWEKLHLPDLVRMLAVDYKTYLSDDILTKVDRATMSVSLEGREPFMDHHIIEFVARLPIDYKYHKGQTKCILRDILYKYIPRRLIDRPKMGFGIPLEHWCRHDPKLSGWLRHHLSKEAIEATGIFNYPVIGRELGRYFQGKRVSFNKIWTLFMFQLWYDRWM